LQKAYKLLALQEGISNKRAKELIDRGLVYVGDKKVKIARAELPSDTKFNIQNPDDIRVIYEDDKLVAINKPAFIDSYEIERALKGAKLIHRLDRETSGVLLLAKDEEFLKMAIRAFKNLEVKKGYIAWVEGVVVEPLEIDFPLLTFKRGNRAFSKVDMKKGKRAITLLYPDEVQGKKSKVKLEIKTGRTHQIRAHLGYIGHPVVGDEAYGSPTKAKRVLLHANSIEILGYKFVAPEPKDIKRYK